VNKLADAMERDRVQLASLDSLDNGKPYTDALTIDLHLAVKCFRYYAGWADKICGKTVPIDGAYLSMTRLEPVGVCAQIIPWNFPLLMACWKLAPALAAGCCVVIKSAEQTPLSLLHLAALVAEVGFPPGVVNALSGYGPTCGAPMVVHRDVDKVAFTGSTDVGRTIQREAAGTLKGVTLELGGKSPAIVCADADLDAAIEACTFGLFFNAGQVCCASSRIFVHESLYDAFVAKAAERARGITTGAGLTSGAAQGPQVDQDSVDKIDRLVQCGVAEGARLVAGGAKVPGPGYFFAPTVFADVTDGMTIAREEIFGPVMSVLKFRDTEEVIARANDTIYGLASAVFTTSLDNATAISLGLRAGTCWVNCFDVLEASVPFGGYKASGVGRELGEYGLQQYSEVKTITIKLGGQKNS
jgi:aldehyde dehydrogenase (NAD+)